MVAAVLLAGCTSSATPSADSAGSPTPVASATPSPTPKPTGEADPALKPFYGQQIAWAACADDAGTEKVDESAFQCGKLRVPLDYTAPADEAIEIALARRQAAKPDQRLGSLLVNPGGPGSSGVGHVQHSSLYREGPLRDRFDLVGFDPRGVASSAPVRCLDDKAQDAWDSSDARNGSRGKTLADGCAANSGKLLAHVGTRDAARDLDVLRAALGEPKLNYLGFSYGTYLGTRYAEQFPEKVGRVVLDGAVDPLTTTFDSTVLQSISFEKSLRAFAADCAGQAQCTLGKDPAKAAEKLAKFLDGLKDEPLTTSDGRKLTAWSGWTGVLAGLYGDQSRWENLRNSIGWAMARDKGDYLLALADSYYGREENGTHDNGMDAYAAILCADPMAAPPTDAQFQAAKQQLHDQAPLISAHFADEDLFDPDCRAWPYHPVEQLKPIGPTGPEPILVVGSTGDPATPYAWAEKLSTLLTNGVLLTREGEGHTGYGKNTCTTDAVNTFLTTGQAPPKGTRCAGQ
ncbi:MULTISPECIES: alpha/beta hydrolase [unclassified Kitasatospora]|uniref:alpha/beta hydrolase n=1 Tax=unclassified Kitasatospora TaxID=2633591 RepID=UPI000AC90CE6|nr:MULTISPECIES: alpha/beta hydrolase [unclassified Kitasatospora]